MKKKKPIDTNNDSVDGLKMVGCLFAGVFLIALVISIAGTIINALKH